MFKGFVAIFTKHGVTYGILADSTIQIIAIGGKAA
jgi:hypothetical protein